MKINTFEYSKSSFFGMQKDAALIMQRILKSPCHSQNILRLLAYNDRDWDKKDAKHPDVTGDQIKEMFETQQISAVPKIIIDKPDKTYLRLSYGTTIPNMTNPEYRDNTFGIDIICHYDNWDLGDFELRPYRIAGEIDSLLDKTHLTGIGELKFVSCSPYVYNEEFAGVTLTYLAIRGHEDDKP